MFSPSSYYNRGHKALKRSNASPGTRRRDRKTRCHVPLLPLEITLIRYCVVNDNSNHARVRYCFVDGVTDVAHVLPVLEGGIQMNVYGVYEF